MPNDIPLHHLDSLPAGLEMLAPEELHQLLGGPTLIQLPGRRPEPLLVSVLLHGNETTSWLAMREVLKRYRGKTLPRALSLFIGNTEAAAQGRRRLDHQQDYNRAWRGTELGDCAETRLMQEVFDAIQACRPFASLDIHNNTGLNPFYACVNVLRSPHLQLASQFSRTVVYFVQPRGTQAAAMADVCPAITMECGKPGEPSGVARVTEFIDACLHMASIPDHPPAAHDLTLYHTVARVRVPEWVEFGFGRDSNAPLRFIEDLERLNFQQVSEGVVLGYCDDDSRQWLQVESENGETCSAHYFYSAAGHLLLKRPAVMSMLTQDERVIRQDCLCYLMEEFPWQAQLET